MKKIQSYTILILASLIITSFISSTPSVKAATPEGFGGSKISFTFDDGFASDMKAADILASNGQSGVAYITTNFIGTPNYMSWEQVTTLQDKYGWEIGSHSISHPLLTQASADQKELEIGGSKDILISHGFNPLSFATPYGDYDPTVQAVIAKYYTSHRPFHDTQGSNIYPYDSSLLYVRQVQGGVSVAQVQGYINEAIQNNTWLILVFHDIQDSASQNPEDYQYSSTDLKAISDYVKSVNIPVATISETMATSAIQGSNSD